MHFSNIHNCQGWAKQTLQLKLHLGLPHGWQECKGRTIIRCLPLPGCASTGSWLWSGEARSQTRHSNTWWRQPVQQPDPRTKHLSLILLISLKSHVHFTASYIYTHIWICAFKYVPVSTEMSHLKVLTPQTPIRKPETQNSRTQLLQLPLHKSGVRNQVKCLPSSFRNFHSLKNKSIPSKH